MKNSLSDTVYWGKTHITYRYEYADRKTLAISVHPDLAVTVKAPAGTPLEKIRAKVKKRAGWIRKARRAFELYLPKQPERRYLNGEAHRYLGRQYRLKAVQGQEESVKCLRGYFWVTTREEPASSKVKRCLESWYRIKAIRIFSERLKICHKKFTRHQIEKPAFTIRKMTTRWGSYSPAGRITLNLELIKTPKDCIDYVIVHELCHMVVPHHGNRFWRLIQNVMPDYEERRRRLNMFADI